MSSNRILFATALAASLAFAPPAASAAGHPHQRDGWNVGFGLGGGNADRTYSGGTSFEREDGITGNIRLGIPMGKTMHFALETNGWRKAQNGESVMFNAFTGGVAWFPSGGWVLRGGVGLGVTTESVSFEGGNLVSTENGFGVNAGLGYEFRLTHTFSLGPQIDGGFITIDSGDANWGSVSVQANWYFIPKF